MVDVAETLLGITSDDDAMFVYLAGGTSLRLRPGADADTLKRKRWWPVRGRVLAVCEDGRYRLMFSMDNLNLAMYVGGEDLATVLVADTDVELPDVASLRLGAGAAVATTPSSGGRTAIRATVITNSGTFAASGEVPNEAVGIEYRPGKPLAVADYDAGEWAEPFEFAMYTAPGGELFLEATNGPSVRLLPDRERGYRLVEVVNAEIVATGWVRDDQLDGGVIGGVMGGVWDDSGESVTVLAGTLLYDEPNGAVVGAIGDGEDYEIAGWPSRETGWHLIGANTSIGSVTLAVQTKRLRQHELRQLGPDVSH